MNTICTFQHPPISTCGLLSRRVLPPHPLNSPYLKVDLKEVSGWSRSGRDGEREGEKIIHQDIILSSRFFQSGWRHRHKINKWNIINMVMKILASKGSLAFSLALSPPPPSHTHTHSHTRFELQYHLSNVSAVFPVSKGVCLKKS